ncbi:MAG: heme ABC exporter ATP-binding protein CcmA [Pseudomonadota bacterium]
MISYTKTTLHAQDVTISRGGLTVLSNVSFQVESGGALVVEGPNGSGKSSLLRACAGLITPAAGRIGVGGAHRADPIHFVGHLNAIKLQLSVFENAAFWAEPHEGEGKDERADSALDALGLGALADTKAQYLSQGQRRRLALCRLLSASRPIWLLDEPVAGLDQAAREGFAKIMADHRASGGVIIAATHEDLGLSAPSALAL